MIGMPVICVIWATWNFCPVVLGSVEELVEKLDGLSVIFPHKNKKTVDPLPTLRSLTQKTIKNKEQTVPGFYLDRLVKQSKKIGLLE